MEWVFIYGGVPHLRARSVVGYFKSAHMSKNKKNIRTAADTIKKKKNLEKL